MLDATRRQSLVTVPHIAKPLSRGELIRLSLRRRYSRSLIRQDSDVVIVDLDSDVELAIAAIETIARGSASATVMAYSSKNDTTMLRRFQCRPARGNF